MVWRGVAPLIHHDGKLANPLNPAARRIKSLSGKRRKTDEDLYDLARAEFDGSMYFDDRFGPVVPTDCIFATLVNGAKKSKVSKEVALGVFVEGINGSGDAGVVKLEYSGPRDLDKLWGDGNTKFVFTRPVIVQRARIMRTRPIFPEWSLKILLKFDPGVVNREVIVRASQDAGFYIGLLDYRPRYGRFSVEVL